MQVVVVAPRQGRVRPLRQDDLVEALDAQLRAVLARQQLDDVRPRPRDDRGPVLRRLARRAVRRLELDRIAGIVEEVTDGNEDDHRVATLGRGRRIGARGDVDVEAGLLGDEVFFEDAVEAGGVVFCEEDVVGCEFGELAVEGPVEGYAGAGCFALC